jgi:predicted DNA-binding ribbon-helix-helix protein
MELQRVTLKLETNLLVKLRKIAADRRTTISKLLPQQLDEDPRLAGKAAIPRGSVSRRKRTTSRTAARRPGRGARDNKR